MDLPFRLLNVFSLDGDPFSGNPLAVVTEAGGLSDAQMQAWARQFNLSETAFVTSHDGAGHATVRIFTPGHEMPFAGHPTLGTASVVAALALSPLDAVSLTVPAGEIPVSRLGAGWRLTAPVATTREVTSSQADLAGGLGRRPLRRGAFGCPVGQRRCGAARRAGRLGGGGSGLPPRRDRDG